MPFRLAAGQHSHEEFHSELYIPFNYIPLRKVSKDPKFHSLASSEFPVQNHMSGQQSHGSHMQLLAHPYMA